MTIQSFTLDTYTSREGAERAQAHVQRAFAGTYWARRDGFEIGIAPGGGIFRLFVQADVDEETDGGSISEIAAWLLLQVLMK